MENMGAVCVIHGENNVGKSNLLEAQFLFLQIMPFFIAQLWAILKKVSIYSRLVISYILIMDFHSEN